MEKQTSIDWLEMQIVELEKDYAIPHKIYELCEKAKQMHKEEGFRIEGSYNEEEVIQIFDDWYKFDCHQDSFGGKDDLTFKQWFEQFKKGGNNAS